MISKIQGWRGCGGGHDLAEVLLLHLPRDRLVAYRVWRLAMCVEGGLGAGIDW